MRPLEVGLKQLACSDREGAYSCDGAAILSGQRPPSRNPSNSDGQARGAISACHRNRLVVTSTIARKLAKQITSVYWIHETHTRHDLRWIHVHNTRYCLSSPSPHILPASRISCLDALPRRLFGHPPRHIKVLQRIRCACSTTEYALLLVLFKLFLHLRIHYDSQAYQPSRT